MFIFFHKNILLSELFISLSPRSYAALAAVWLGDGEYRVVPTKMDGQCFYRSASMHQTGVLEDDDLKSYTLRKDVIDQAKKWFDGAAGDEKR